MTNRKEGRQTDRQTDRQTNRQTDGGTDRQTDTRGKAIYLTTLSGEGIIIHQNETKKHAHVSQLSELKHTSSLATVDDDTTSTMRVVAIYKGCHGFP